MSYNFLMVIVVLFCWLSSSYSFAQTIEWSGTTWDVKSGSGLGPGPNNWSDSEDSVWVDEQGNLHLTVRQENGIWYSSEIYSQESLGYGNYEFRIESNTENYDPNVVAGFFTYLSDDEEIDIELTRFGNAQRSNAHFTVQPYHVPGNSIEFDLGLSGDFSTHRFNWTAEQVDFQSLHGHHSTPPTAGHIINQWTYNGSDIPAASSEKVHINFWLFQGNAPVNGQKHELVIDSFSFTPALVLGDVNCDGIVNLLDVAPFVNSLTTGEYLDKSDINQDGVINLLDVAPFVEILAEGM